MSCLLSAKNVACAYQQRPVVAGVNFEVKAGEIACLLGPSGCGKTTLLRAVAGFLPLHTGQVFLDGKPVSGGGVQVAPEKRQMGMVFQDYALFPHLTVAANIAFGLSKWRRQQREERVDEMLSLIRLTDLKNRYPHELSGGQQQRIALARALAPKPKLLLMDEPFSNLDTDLRQQLSLEVRDILKDQGIAAIVVTHDQHEAFVLGDKVGILADGVLQQWASPETLYRDPANERVASFVGKGMKISGQFQSSDALSTRVGQLKLREQLTQSLQSEGQDFTVFVRPSDIWLVANGSDAVIRSREFLGNQTRYVVEHVDELRIEVESYEQHSFKVGEHVNVRLMSEGVLVFAGQGNEQVLVGKGACCEVAPAARF